MTTPNNAGNIAVEEFFTCVTRHPKPASTLYDEELNVLQQVIYSIVQQYAPGARRGSFILDGQPSGQPAYAILRFNLPDGSYERRFFRDQGQDSDDLAEESIDQLLELPHPSRYTSGDSEQRQRLRDAIKSVRDVMPGIWRDGELQVLVLNTMYGRFLASCFIEDPSADPANADQADISEIVLYAVAETLARLCREDRVLQLSVCDVAQDGRKYGEVYRQVVERLICMFEGRDTPALQAWKSWHDMGIAAGKLTLFFE